MLIIKMTPTELANNKEAIKDKLLRAVTRITAYAVPANVERCCKVVADAILAVGLKATPLDYYLLAQVVAEPMANAESDRVKGYIKLERISGACYEIIARNEVTIQIK